MIHFVGLGKGDGGLSTATVSFSPVPDTYTGTAKFVTITVTNAAKLRWNIDGGGWTTVNALTTGVSVPLSAVGHTLNAEALNAAGATLAMKSGLYQRDVG